MPIDSEDLAFLEKLGCFGISTYDSFKLKDWGKGKLDACRRFVKPLMASATHARLYPSKRFSEDIGPCATFLIPRKGYYEFDLSKECVSGYEKFWQAGASGGEYQRGTIVVVQLGAVSLIRLLIDCVLDGMPSSRYQILKGSSVAAVRFAEKHNRKAERLFLFSASNGVEHVWIYPPRGRAESDYVAASESANKPHWM